MTETYKCPAEGCDYTGNKASVAGHYSGMRDKPHKGGFEKAMILLDGDDTTSSPDAEDDSESDGDKDPAKATPESNETDLIPNCPECGSELVDYRTDDSVSVDFICSDCESGWVDQ